MSGEPMTDERLAEINGLTATVFQATIHADFDETTAWLAILDLRREVERLRAENAAMRQIVQAVASSNPYGSWYPATNALAGVVCRWCMERARSPKECQHDHECTWRQARAIADGHLTAGGRVER